MTRKVAGSEEFTLVGTVKLTGERFSRSTPDADARFRENIASGLAVWNTTARDAANTVGIDADAFEAFMAKERGAELVWVTRFAAFSERPAASYLVPQTENAQRNALAYLELISSGDDLQSMLETLIVAQRGGLLPELLHALNGLSNAALSAEGEDPERVRTLVRRVTGAR
jgi:hypothetical protein